MSPSKPFMLQLDNDAVDRLLSPIVAEDDFVQGKETTVHVRLRYLQKLGFPATAKTGRGKKAVHGIESVLQLAIAFEMLAIGVSPKKAAATVSEYWGQMHRALQCGWRLRQGAGSMCSEDQSAEAGLIVVRPSGSEQDDALLCYTLTYDQLIEILPGKDNFKAIVLIDAYPFLLGLEQALINQLRLRDEDVEEALGGYLGTHT